MAVGTLAPETEAVPSLPAKDCRVYQRHVSDLPIQCQPVAARGDHEVMWPATVRDISSGGLALVLNRRFEPRTGLAIELPDSDGSPYTVFVRVVRAAPQPDGRWLLGCMFVSPLSEERLNELLQASPRGQRPLQAAVAEQPGHHADQERSIVTGVHFRTTLPDGTLLSRRVTRLHMTGPFPMSPGHVVTVWVGKGEKNGSAVMMKVTACRNNGTEWLVECSFVDAPSAELVRSLKEK